MNNSRKFNNFTSKAAILICMTALVVAGLAGCGSKNDTTAQNTAGGPKAESTVESAAEVTSTGTEGSIKIGSEVGDELGDFSVELIGGGTFHLHEARGHVTIINSWATWCGPCVEELPEFAEFSKNHPEVFMLAAHIPDDSDVEGFLDAADLKLNFCRDDDGTIYEIIGSPAYIPQTIVLDADGVVVYKNAGAMTYEQLEEVVNSIGG